MKPHGCAPRRRSTVTTGAAAAAMAILTSFTASCAPAEVAFTLTFPSLDTFLISSTAEITVYEAGDDVDPDDICRNLSVGQASGAGDPIDSTGAIDVCDLESGHVLEGIPVGRVVIFAQVQSGGVVLLRGCKVTDVYATGTENVAVTLATLPTYPDSPTIQCTTVEEKCADGKQCLAN